MTADIDRALVLVEELRTILVQERDLRRDLGIGFPNWMERMDGLVKQLRSELLAMEAVRPETRSLVGAHTERKMEERR